MRITVDEITRIMRHYLMRQSERREQEAVRRAALIAECESEGFPALWRGRLPDGPPDLNRERYTHQWAEERLRVRRPLRTIDVPPYVVAQHRALMEQFYGEPEPDDVDRVQPSIRDQWEQHAAVSPTYDPTPRTEAHMSTDDILVAIDESLREYDDEAHANEQAQADKIASRKDRRGETAAAGGASPSDILDRIAVPGGNWPTEV